MSRPDSYTFECVVAGLGECRSEIDPGKHGEAPRGRASIPALADDDEEWELL